MAARRLEYADELASSMNQNLAGTLRPFVLMLMMKPAIRK